MARKPLTRTSAHPYHVTVRCNNRDWFYIGMGRVWAIFEFLLCDLKERYGVVPHAFVLMNNHFHLILSTPNENLDLAMKYLLSKVSRRIAAYAGRINHVFGSRYKWSVQKGSWAEAYVLKYVLRNPVRAGICDRAEDYRFSTIFGLSKPDFKPWIEIPPIPSWEFVPSTIPEFLQWINKPTDRELELLIRSGLRRSEFAFSNSKGIAKMQLRLAREYLYREDQI